LSYLDFETISLAIPRWKGTRPFEQVPFQFSIHVERDGGPPIHREFLDLSGEDPRRPCADALVEMIPSRGAIVSYNAGFERRCVRQLAEQFPDVADPLLAIAARIVDLLPVAKACWYHPEQRGSWSIKDVLPSLVPELSYEKLAVGDGGAAQTAYVDAIDPATAGERKEELDKALRLYCGLDTEALMLVFHCLVNEPRSVAAAD
jgi:hypothetical protein